MFQKVKKRTIHSKVHLGPIWLNSSKIREFKQCITMNLKPKGRETTMIFSDSVRQAYNKQSKLRHVSIDKLCLYLTRVSTGGNCYANDGFDRKFLKTFRNEKITIKKIQGGTKQFKNVYV